jgi:hypothetical protein
VVAAAGARFFFFFFFFEQLERHAQRKPAAYRGAD